MIAQSQKHRFITKKEAIYWLNANNFKQVRGMKGYYLNDKYSANLQHMPSGAWLCLLVLVIDNKELKYVSIMDCVRIINRRNRKR